MEATAQDSTIEAAPSGLRPPGLAVVPDHEDTHREPNVGRNATIGALVGFVLATVAMTVAGLIGGIGAGSALGLGVFVGIWGGAGFGFMLGGTIPLALYLDADHH